MRFDDNIGFPGEPFLGLPRSQRQGASQRAPPTWGPSGDLIAPGAAARFADSRPFALYDYPMNLPDPGSLIDRFDADLADEDLNVGAAVEEALEDHDGPTKYYARRRLDGELARSGAASGDALAGIGVDAADRRAIDDWIPRYVGEWRTRFGDVEERPAQIMS